MKFTRTRASRVALLTFAALAVTTTRTEALNQYPYQSIPNGGKYTAAASYYGSTSASASFSLDQDSSIRQLAFAAQGYYAAIRNGLNAALGVVDSPITLAYPGILTGTLNAAISPLPNGNMRVSVGGPLYAVQFATDHVEHGIIHVSCYTFLNVALGSSTSEFNPSSGAVTPGQTNVTVSPFTSCTNNFSWVPYLGNYISAAGVRITNATIAQQSGSFGQLLDVQPQRALFGFVNAISANTYMLGGIDLGMFLKNNIAGLYAGRQMTVSIGDPAAVYAPTIKNTAGPSQYSGTAFSVMFSDNGINTAGFKLDETRYYLWKQLIPDDEANIVAPAGTAARPKASLPGATLGHPSTGQRAPAMR